MPASSAAAGRSRRRTARGARGRARPARVSAGRCAPGGPRRRGAGTRRGRPPAPPVLDPLQHARTGAAGPQLLDGPGDGGQAVRARPALAGGLGGQPGGHARELRHGAAGGGHGHDDAGAERRAVRRERSGLEREGEGRGGRQPPRSSRRGRSSRSARAPRRRARSRRAPACRRPPRRRRACGRRRSR